MSSNLEQSSGDLVGAVEEHEEFPPAADLGNLDPLLLGWVHAWSMEGGGWRMQGAGVRPVGL